MKILFKNARILKMDDTPIFMGHLLVENDLIKEISSTPINEEGVDIIKECRGNLLMPGFKNAHAHSAMSFLRSKTDGLKLQDWLFNVVIPREEEFIKDDVYHFAKVAILEYLSGGITACFDQYYTPLETAKAAKEMGFRIVLLGTYNDSYQKVVDVYHQINDEKDSLVSYCLGIHAEYTLQEHELPMMKKLIDELHSPFFVHIAETEKEVKECYERRGCSPVEFFIKEGLYDFGGGGYHCIYFSKKDMELYKDKGLYVVSCPGSNSKLASGIPPILEYLKMGIPVALGTDGPASNNCLDMFKEMSLTFSLQNLANHNPACLSSYEILKMATVNAARAMGLKNADILEKNKKADIIMIDLSRPSMQPINDIITNIVYSGNKDVIKMTMINGRILYEDYKFNLDEDIETIYQNASKAKDDLEKRYLSKKH